ncbi:MAG: hypothetical protein ACI8ZN_002132 [Bacteroidia bacterium]|jgi:hypothetical protein
MNKQEIEDWLRQTWQLVLELKISIKNAKTISEYDIHLHSMVTKHGFFQHHFKQLHFITAIQLCKLLSDKSNQKINLAKFLRRLSSESYDQDLTALLNTNREKNINSLFSSKNDIVDFASEINKKLNDHQPLIERVEKMRDKMYAHKDPNNIPQTVSFKELEELVEFVTKLQDDLEYKFFNVRNAFDQLAPWDIEQIIKDLTEFKQIKKQRW